MSQQSLLPSLGRPPCRMERKGRSTITYTCGFDHCAKCASHPVYAKDAEGRSVLRARCRCGVPFLNGLFGEAYPEESWFVVVEPMGVEGVVVRGL